MHLTVSLYTVLFKTKIKSFKRNVYTIFPNDKIKKVLIIVFVIKYVIKDKEVTR